MLRQLDSARRLAHVDPDVAVTGHRIEHARIVRADSTALIRERHAVHDLPRLAVRLDSARDADCSWLTRTAEPRPRSMVVTVRRSVWFDTQSPQSEHAHSDSVRPQQNCKVLSHERLNGFCGGRSARQGPTAGYISGRMLDPTTRRQRLARVLREVRVPAGTPVLLASDSNDTWRIGSVVLRICWRGDRDRFAREAAVTAALPPGVPYPGGSCNRPR